MQGDTFFIEVLIPVKITQEQLKDTVVQAIEELIKQKDRLTCSTRANLIEKVQGLVEIHVNGGV